MLKYVKNNKEYSISQAMKKYPNSKMVFLIDDFPDLNNLKGRIYAVSKNSKSYKELCKEGKKLSKKGLNTMIIGDYRVEDLLYV